MVHGKRRHMTTSQNINSGSYAQLENFDSVSYNCIKYLLDNDEEIWKLLYYKTPDAWEKPPISYEQKTSLIYNGDDDTSKFNVFLDQGSPDVITREDCILRISPHSVFPENRTVVTLNIIFEVYSHYHINTLTNYKTRTDMIAQRIIQLFNGKNVVDGIGKLFFDRMGSEANRLEWGSQTPHKGRWFILSTKAI